MSKLTGYFLLGGLIIMLGMLLFVKKESMDLVEMSLERDREYQVKLSEKRLTVQEQDVYIQKLQMLLSQFL